MDITPLSIALSHIDQINASDPNVELWQGKKYPKELLYSMRMSTWLAKLKPEPSESLQLAARAQHITRWQVPRDSFPEGREGYLRWRKHLYRYHGEQAALIMRAAGFDEALCERVQAIIGKEGIKRDPDVQCIEDVACLVFLEFYFPEFAEKYSQEKLIDILRKTWKKMSEQGHQAALSLSFSAELTSLLTKALSTD